VGQAMVRISDRARKTLREIAQSEEESMQAVLEKAVEEYRRRHFLELVNRAYQEVRDDPEAWAEELAERAQWDETLQDGLPSGEVWEGPKKVHRPARGEKS